MKAIGLISCFDAKNSLGLAELFFERKKLTNTSELRKLVMITLV